MIHFDNNPTLYWLCGYLLTGIVILCAISKKVPLAGFIVACMLLLVGMRMPVVVFNRELNADESQMLSHAITLNQDPIYWQSADGTTIGPLDNYLLVIPKLLGFQIDYTSGRAMGLLCTAAAILFLFFSLRQIFGEQTARISILFPLFLLAFTQEVDFVHYSSEQLPVLLLSACLWLLTQLFHSDKNRSTIGFSLALLAGMIPFAKLQAVPMAIVLVSCALWVTFTKFKRNRQIKPILAIMAGGITFPLLVLIWTIYYDVFDDLIDFYILGNVIYAGGNEAPAIPVQFFKIFNLSADFKAFTFALLIPMLAGLWYLITTRKSCAIKSHTIIISAIALLILSSIYAVTKSGNDFIHYLNFCIIPWTLLAAWGIQKWGIKSIVFPVFLILWFFIGDALSYKKHHLLNSFASDNARSLAQSPVVSELKKYTKEKDFMAVWGWQCSYYVEAQLAEATAENHSERSIFKHAMQDKYKSRYLSDIQRTTPAIFLDAVGKNSLWVQDRKTQGFENFPELADFINRNYTYQGLFDDTRLYVRNDRIKTP